MGYESNFSLNIRKADDSTFDTEKVKKEIIRISGYDTIRDSQTDDPTRKLSLILKEATWSKCIEHLVKYFGQHPDLICELFIEGEDRYDNRNFLFMSGKMYERNQVGFTPPVPDGSTVTVASFNKESQTLKIEAVAKERVQEELKQKKESGFAEIISSLRIYDSGTIDLGPGNDTI